MAPKEFFETENVSLLKKTFSIVIPAYNEERRISPILTDAAEFISSFGLPWEIIVSIDGNDGTEEIVKEISRKYEFVSHLKSCGRNGKGNAIAKAINIASGEFVVLMDADGSVSLTNILKSIEFMNNYDIIIFDRYSNSENRIPFVRRFASRCFNVLLRGLLGIKINDTQCGYKIIRRDLANDAFKKISISNAFFDVALLYYLEKSGAKSIEVPIKYDHHNESKFNVLGLALGLGTSLMAFKVRNSGFHKYIPKQLVELYYKKFKWI